MSVIVAVMNAKGGVGKSTTTMMLAEALCALHGARILVVDSDPQASVSLMLVGQERLEMLQEDKLSLPDVLSASDTTALDDRLGKAMQWHVSDVKDLRGLALLPSNISLAWVDRIECHHIYCPFRKLNSGQTIELPIDSGNIRGDEQTEAPVVGRKEEPEAHALADKESGIGGNFRTGISGRIAQLAGRLRSDFDYVLVDCPPSISTLTESWLAHSDFYLAPAKPDYLSIVGLGLLGRLNTEAALRGDAFAGNIGTIITMGRSNNKSDLRWVTELTGNVRFRCFPMQFGLAVDIARAGEYAIEKRSFAAKYPSPLFGKIGAFAQEFVARTEKQSKI